MPRSYTTPTGISLTHVRTLGSGQFGVATEVRSRHGMHYCMKEIAFKGTEDKDIALQEVKMMKNTCGHPNVISCHEWWFERNRLCILMELASNGSLETLINKYISMKKLFPPRKVEHIAEELASALDYCHSLRVMHRDIKPANIVIDDLGSVKLTDFGLSKCLGPTNLAQTFCGSPIYMSPEQCSAGERYSFSADVWSLGVVVYEIMALRSPWSSKDGKDPTSFPALVIRILNASPDYSVISSLYPTRLIDMVRWMLQRNLSKRATAADIAGLMEMRSPPTMDQTVGRELPPPPSPTAPSTLPPIEVSDNPFYTGPPPSRRDTVERRMDIVKEARALVAASSIQRSFRLSMQRRRIQQMEPVPPPTPPRTLERFDRPKTEAVQMRVRRVTPPDAPPSIFKPSPPPTAKMNSSVTKIQRAMRTSLNRRRGIVAPKTPPPQPIRVCTTPNNGCSTRIQQLAIPRVTRGWTPRTQQPVPSKRPSPRKAWQ